MLNAQGAMPCINHAAMSASQARGGATRQADDVHEAMGRIADIIVESGEGLTLESLIKAFWRSYSTPDGSGSNIVSIHEARGAASDTPLPEDAFARLAGRMDRLAEELGFVTDRGPRPQSVQPAQRDVAEGLLAAARHAYGSPRGAFDDLPGAANRRHRHDAGQDMGDGTGTLDFALPDRATFDAMLERNYRIARNEVEPLSVAICSVSRIDAILKNHGIATAQRLLDRVASTLSAATRGECYSARKSNSEFIMLARGITVSQFCAVLEESTASLAARRWHDKYSSQTLGMIDLHVGVAHVFDFANPSLAMRAADLAHEQAALQQTTNLVLADAR